MLIIGETGVRYLGTLQFSQFFCKSETILKQKGIFLSVFINNKKTWLLNPVDVD